MENQDQEISRAQDQDQEISRAQDQDQDQDQEISKAKDQDQDQDQKISQDQDKEISQAQDQDQDQAESEMSHILVAVTQSRKKGYPNPSKRSKVAFEWILENVVQSNVDRFHLQILHVQYPNARDEENEEAVNLLEYFEFECHKIGVANASWLARGLDPKVVICKEVERINADLLVMGTGNFGSFRRIFNRNRGESVCEYCLKNAECPVIAVNEKAAKRHNVLQKLRQTS